MNGDPEDDSDEFSIIVHEGQHRVLRASAYGMEWHGWPMMIGPIACIYQSSFGLGGLDDPLCMPKKVGVETYWPMIMTLPDVPDEWVEKTADMAMSIFGAPVVLRAIAARGEK